MSFKTPLYCDRRVYDKKGKWKNPNNNVEENIFYFIKEPLTLVSDYSSGREELKETLTITIFGGKPIVQYDKIVLDNGTEYKVKNVVANQFESNILVRDMLKPRIESMDLELE